MSIQIMVIEDEELLLKAIVKKLTIHNFETISCTSAEQALDYMESLEKNPDAIWLDYHLKGMNGLEFIEKVKENTKWANIPIVVVSNSAGDETVKTVLALGADKYLLKAKYKLEDVIAIVQELIKK